MTEFEGISGVSVIQRPFALMAGLADVPRDHLRLLRLFKEGNPIMRYAFLYYEKPSGVEITNVAQELPIADSAEFTLTDAEIPPAQTFIEKHRLPFKERSIQRAFESFDLSYEIHDTGLAFLSLMIAREVLLGPEGTTEITHQVSRNTAVLLGSSRSEAQEIYRNMKRLYKRRSQIVHGDPPSKEKDQLTRKDLLTLREYTRRAIRELYAMGKTENKSLQEVLNPCGFGDRPWRDKE